LLYVIDESERYGVVFIDESRWRFFEVFLGEIEEIANAFLDLSGEKPPERPRSASLYGPTPKTHVSLRSTCFADSGIC
jgi:Bacterial archaeo-eukaryotic release factor family 10